MCYINLLQQLLPYCILLHLPFEWKRDGKVDVSCLDQWERAKKHWVVYSNLEASTSLLSQRETREAMDKDEVQRRMEEVTKLVAGGKQLCEQQSTMFQLHARMDGQWPIFLRESSK
jgi:hypothetical protein